MSAITTTIHTLTTSLREWRSAQARHASLMQDLRAFTSRQELNELLAMLEDSDSRAVAETREAILARLVEVEALRRGNGIGLAA